MADQSERTCQMPIPEAEWMDRLRKRFAERAAMSDEGVRAVSDACTFEEWSDGFEDDPEGAADEEMSYWAGDGDE